MRHFGTIPYYSKSVTALFTPNSHRFPPVHGVLVGLITFRVPWTVPLMSAIKAGHVRHIRHSAPALLQAPSQVNCRNQICGGELVEHRTSGLVESLLANRELVEHSCEMVCGGELVEHSCA